LSAVLLIAFVSSAYAYWKITTPSIPTLYATAIDSPLELRVQLDKNEFELGERITIHFSLKNLKSENTSVVFASMRHYFEFRVLDEKNREVFTTLYWGGATETEAVVLGPNEKLNQEQYWNQVSSVEGEYLWKQVPRGIYQIVGFTGYMGWIGRESPTSATRIEAPPIPITLH
jgi:hypothetical protein